MNIEVIKTLKPFGLFRQTMTTRFEVHVDGVHRATFAGEANLDEAEAAAYEFKRLLEDGKEIEAENFLVDFAQV